MTTIDMDEVRSWAVAAGTLARHYFNNVASQRKADRSFVTEADRAIEQQLVAKITNRYPQHGILGEEQTSTSLESEFVWVLDPIDGTASFVSGLGSWCISIGVLRHGLPYLGVIYLPMLDDCYHAVADEPAFLNDRKITVIAPGEWEREHWLATPATLHHNFELEFVGKTRVLGSTAAQMCYVARGSALAALLAEIQPWDIAAGLVITQSAGGSIAPLNPQATISHSLLDPNWRATPLLIAHNSQIPALRQIFTPKLLK